MVQRCLVFCFALQVVFLDCFSGAAGIATNITSPPHFPIPARKRYVVRLRSEVNQSSYATEQQVARSQVFQHIFNGFVADLDADQAAALEKDSRVMAIAEDTIIATAIGQVIPDGITRIAVDQFPLVHIDGTDRRINVDIAMLDSGVQTNHPDLNVVQAVDFTGQGVFGTNAHGTACAGVAAALDNNMGVVGVAPGARIWSVRGLDESGSATMSSLMASFDYVASHSNQISVCNCSFATTYGGNNSATRAFEQPAVQTLVNLGIVVVAGAGNDGGDIAGPDGILDTSDDTMPAAFPESMTVSAMDAVTDTLVSFSNFSRTRHATNFVTSSGAAIDVAAPGNNIYTTIPDSGYLIGSGTSFATPHVTGLVALYIATHGRATNAAGVYAIRQAIINAALPQSQWRTTNTFDPDTNHEGLATASIAWVTNAPRFQSVTKVGSNARLTFNTFTGYTHTVEYATSLHATNLWTNLISTNGTGGTVTVSDSALNPARVYRLGSQPILATPFPVRTVATNIGSLGTSANGTYIGTSNGVAGALVGNASNSAVFIPTENIGGRVEIPFQPKLNPSGAFSVELWCKPTTTNFSVVAASSDGFTNATQGGWILFQSSSTLDSGNGWIFRCYTTTGNTTYFYIYDNLQLNTNNWYHVVGTYDGTNQALYVNGAMIGPFAISPFRPNPVSPITLGVEAAGGGRCFAAYDEFAFYTNALSSARVLAHYQTATNTSPVTPYQQVILSDAPAGYWRLNEH